MKLVDVHCHLFHELFKNDLDEVLKRAEKGGLSVEEVPDTNGLVIVKDAQGKQMRMYFEDTLVYEENR
ncbi:MAG: hypothetical protein ACE5RJ_04805, partial [Nitrosopumilaceae archaeon]